MRKLPAALMVSVISHAVAIAWIVRDGEVLAVPLPSSRAVTAASPSEPPPSPPLAVVLLDAPDAPAPIPPSPARAASATGTSGHERARGAPAIAAGAAQGTEQPAGERRSPWLTMRGPERRHFELSPRFLEDLLSHGKPAAPPPDIPGERIADEIANVRRRLLRAGHESPGQVDALRNQLVALYDERDAEELKAAGGGAYKADKETFTARVEPDGSTHLKEKPGQLDTQDKIMMSMGIDPYARAKLAFLDRTRDQRAAVGERWRHEQLSRSAQLMQRNIDRLWASTGELAARKTGLFELWDDCAETGSDELIAGGLAARRLVIGVIRGRLQGTDAYTAAELARLNSRRRSKAVFAPYEPAAAPAVLDSRPPQ